MSEAKKIAPFLSLKGGENIEKIASCWQSYSDKGAKFLVVLDDSTSYEAHKDVMNTVKELVKNPVLPICCGGSIHHIDDIKKYLYVGCERVIFRASDKKELIEEGLSRFSDKRCAMLVTNKEELAVAKEYHFSHIYCLGEVESGDEIYQLSNNLSDLEKTEDVFTPSVVWSELKLNSDGMIPVVVQDYLTEEVLMVAYMNEEAYNHTLKTGKMTYYSRSRNELWIKGETSGHYQYVKSLKIDCDNDTILARVYQIGAACHTGNKTCFYRDIDSREEATVNPYKVLERDYKVIKDRKENPKKGSYTNYLFEKGLDKILKKVGEEATEIVIASKNEKGSAEEVTYEIADFLYHLMVLMADKEISWEDVARELVNRSN
jgi:phosphoribosyl-ATP pyrophosphohydrolase/phosphoribosyl-AMP cyclohydrolase